MEKEKSDFQPSLVRDWLDGNTWKTQVLTSQIPFMGLANFNLSWKRPVEKKKQRTVMIFWQILDSAYRDIELFFSVLWPGSLLPWHLNLLFTSIYSEK